MDKRRYKTFTTIGLGLSLASILVGLVVTGDAQIVKQETTRKIKILVRPEYPQLARDLKMQGIVRLQTTVSADGRVLNVKELGGNPVLVDAAVRAVRKWKYEGAATDTIEEVKLEFIL